jgi:TetR/AcrR family transcriptional repressor of nem operon
MLAERTDPKSDTKRKILKLADALLREKGFSGFSYADIAQQLGVKNAAIHYHFPSKEDLAVLQQERRRFAKWIARKAIREMDAREKLEWFFSIYTHYLDHGRKLCIPGSLAASFPDIPQSMRAESAALLNEMLDWLAAMLEEGRSAGIFAFDGSAKEMGVMALSTIQGGLQMARITGEERFGITLDKLRAALTPQELLA